MGDLRPLGTMIRGSVLYDEPLNRHTTYGIGGPAGGFIYPADEADLQAALRFAHSSDICVFFIGSGSNLLVADSGFDGIVISLWKHFKTLTIEGTRVHAQCGVMMGHFVSRCVAAQLTGIESLIGVPGTIGGALKMNAGAYGREISQSLVRLNAMTHSGDARVYARSELNFEYRHSSIPDTEVVLSADFEFERGSPEAIDLLRAKASESRKATQPLRFRSAGSVFKNPPGGKSAGFFIDQAGLKGTRRGDAEISSKHANFFVNHGSATSRDVAELIRLARRTVRDRFGVELELEIRTLGFEEGAFDA